MPIRRSAATPPATPPPMAAPLFDDASSFRPSVWILTVGDPLVSWTVVVEIVEADVGWGMVVGCAGIATNKKKKKRKKEKLAMNLVLQSNFTIHRNFCLLVTNCPIHLTEYAKKKRLRPHEINCVFGVSRPTVISQPTVSLFVCLFVCFCTRAPPVASSPRSEQRRTWLIFAKQIEIFQVKAWLATFKARNANLKFLKTIVEKRKKKTARSTCRGRSCPPPLIDRRSPQPQSLEVFFQICRVWFL